MIAAANFLTLLWFGTLWGENLSPENHHTKGAIPVEERKRLGSKSSNIQALVGEYSSQAICIVIDTADLLGQLRQQTLRHGPRGLHRRLSGGL